MDTISIESCADQLAGAFSHLEDVSEPVQRMAGLALAVRAVELRIVDRLLPVAGRFPATIQGHLAGSASPAVSVQDAIVDPASAIDLLDLLELLSEPKLSCVAPRLYRGWQDRVQARREARAICAGAVGFTITADERDALLMAVALRNRLLRVPPPVELEPEMVEEALAAVTGLLERLG